MPKLESLTRNWDESDKHEIGTKATTMRVGQQSRSTKTNRSQLVALYMEAVPSRVERIVETALDSTIQSCERATAGRMAETYLLALDGEPARAVCKIGGPSVRTREVIEPLVVALVDATMDLPVPSVLASGTVSHDGTDTDPNSTTSQWALYEFRDGTTPTPFRSLEFDRQQRIVRQAGSILGQLHTRHQFKQRGGLARTNGNLRICDPEGLYFPERGRTLARQLPSGVDHQYQPVLSHGDFFPGNLLVDEEGTITGLLDWGNAHVTTPGYALARAEMRFVDWFLFPAGKRQTLTTEFRAGYREHRSLPPDFPSLANFYKGLWLVQSGERLTRHLRTTRGRRQLYEHASSLIPGFNDETR